MLKRWSAQFPSTRMPDSLDELELGQQHQLQQADPQLHDLLANKANAELELAAVTGELDDSYTAPTQEQLNSARVAEILAQSPGGTRGHYEENGRFVPGKDAHMGLMVELASLDPMAYQQQELIRNPPAQNEHAVSAEQAARMNAELAATRLQSLNNSNNGVLN